MILHVGGYLYSPACRLAIISSKCLCLRLSAAILASISSSSVFSVVAETFGSEVEARGAGVVIIVVAVVVVLVVVHQYF